MLELFHQMAASMRRFEISEYFHISPHCNWRCNVRMKVWTVTDHSSVQHLQIVLRHVRRHLLRPVADVDKDQVVGLMLQLLHSNTSATARAHTQNHYNPSSTCTLRLNSATDGNTAGTVLSNKQLWITICIWAASDNYIGQHASGGYKLPDWWIVNTKDKRIQHKDCCLTAWADERLHIR